MSAIMYVLRVYHELPGMPTCIAGAAAMASVKHTIHMSSASCFSRSSP